MYFNYKLWLEDESGERFFGKGPTILLKKVDELGSLNQAAIEMNMSYSKAISLIENAEKQLCTKLLIRKAGGTDGGGSTLTEEARELIKKFEEFNKRSNAIIENLYTEIFQEYF